MADPIDIVLGFICGLFTGIIVQYLQLKHSLKIEKIKRLSPYLESAYPIIEKLSNDSRYAANVQLHEDKREFGRTLGRLTISIQEYANWFSVFRTDGMMPELNSVDSSLLSRLVGMFTHADLCKLHGRDYLSQRMQDFAKYCEVCKSMLENRLSD